MLTIPKWAGLFFVLHTLVMTICYYVEGSFMLGTWAVAIDDMILVSQA